MADIADVLGVRTGTRAFTQAYLSRQVVSTLATMLPLIYFMCALDGNKKGMLGIGVPNSGSLYSRVATAKSREKQIFGAESYNPLIHSSLSQEVDGKTMAMRDTVSAVGSSGGSDGIITAIMNGAGIGTLSITAGGQNYNPVSTSTTSIGVLQFLGGGGTAPASSTLTIGTGGVITAAVCDAGSGYLAAPRVVIGSTGTSHDQHFSRPFTKWWERLDPIKVYKKPIRRLKNLMNGASRAEKEKVLGDLLQSATDEARVVHMKNIAKEMWGLTTTNGVPTSQSAEVFDHMLSAPAAMHTTNTYGGVDRSVAANAYWLGKRQTAHVAANLVGLYNEANYTNACLDIGLGISLLMVGPSLFPQFEAQCRAAGGTIYENGLPDMGEFGFRQKVLKFNDMWVIYDPLCPDKLRTDPRTGSAYTKNAAMGINLDTFTVGFSPEAKFSVDKPFDLSQINGEDAWVSRIRTEMFMICEAPAGNFYWEDVG